MRNLPADEGLEGVLECHEGPHDYPVLRVLGDILLGEGAMIKRPPGPEAGEEECEPGAGGDVSGFAGGKGGKMRTREGGRAGTSTWWWLKKEMKSEPVAPERMTSIYGIYAHHWHVLDAVL